jgi:hypothetical protein
MEKYNQHMPGKDNRDFTYDKANDQSTFMTELEKCVNKLEADGFTDQYKVEKGKLFNLTNNKKYKAQDVKAVNFFRFEGQTDPDDMSILYAIETSDGRKGMLINAYGLYSDDDTDSFMRQVEISKNTQA